MEITRTTRLRIDLDAAVCSAMVAAWSDACNEISRRAFENGCLSNAVKLHRLVYQDVCARFGLSAQVTASAIKHVASKYAAARTAKRTLKRPVTFRRCAVVLQGGARGRDFGFTHQGLSVWTIVGRIKSVPFHGEPKLAEYLADDWKMGDGRLFVRKGKVYLTVSFKRGVEAVTKPNDAVVGVDRGINVLATVTDGKRQRFFGGGHLNHVRSRYAKVRASLQRRKTQTKSRSTAKRLQRLSGRERRFQRNTNHVISRRIVDFARDTGNPTIALEDLGGIRHGRRLRKEQRSDLNRWAFYELEQCIRYKAQDFGMDVLGIDPKHTSQACSRCGYTDRANRHGHRFLCKACGYELHADLNASRNVRLRGILARQALCQDGLPSMSPEVRPNDLASKAREGTDKPPALAGGY